MGSTLVNPPQTVDASELIVHTCCRGCGASALMTLFSLGDLCLCNDFIAPEDESVRIPLELVLCDPAQDGCGLVQLRHTTPQRLMYTQYWYKSGLSSTMREHLAALVHKAEQVANLAPGSVVLDIGANDGTTLRAYETKDLRRIGFEPSQLHRESAVGTTAIINDFFNAEAFHRTVGGDKAQVVTTIAMFYDLDDPNRFIHDVTQCLAPEGVWIIEMHYLPSILESNGFDAIVHEHVTYYSLASLERLLAAHDLEVFDIERNAMNGGSFRAYVRHKHASFPVAAGAAARVKRRRRQEETLQLDHPDSYRRLWRRIGRVRTQLRAFLENEVAQGRTIYVYGASTKGNAVLQFFDLDTRLIAAAGDKNADKWGRLTPGTRIPIVSPQQAAEAKPDYMLVLIWHLIDEVVEQWRPYLAAGGKLIVPLPRFRVIDAASANGEAPTAMTSPTAAFDPITTSSTALDVAIAWCRQTGTPEPDTLDRLLTDASVAHGLAPDDRPVVGRAAIGEALERIAQMFPPKTCDVLETVVEDDRVAIRWVMTFASDPAPPHAHEPIHGLTMCLVREGRLVEARLNCAHWWV